MVIDNSNVLDLKVEVKHCFTEYNMLYIIITVEYARYYNFFSFGIQDQFRNNI